MDGSRKDVDEEEKKDEAKHTKKKISSTATCLTVGEGCGALNLDATKVMSAIATA